MPRIMYDDREAFRWVVWVGDLLWSNFRTRQGAVGEVARIHELLAAAEAAGGE